MRLLSASLGLLALVGVALAVTTGDSSSSAQDTASAMSTETAAAASAMTEAATSTGMMSTETSTETPTTTESVTCVEKKDGAPVGASKWNMDPEKTKLLGVHPELAHHLEMWPDALDIHTDAKSFEITADGELVAGGKARGHYVDHICAEEGSGEYFSRFNRVMGPEGKNFTMAGSGIIFNLPDGTYVWVRTLCRRV